MGTGRTLAITVSVLSILGISGYLAYNHFIKPKKDAEKKKADEAKRLADEAAKKNIPATPTGNTPLGGNTYVAPNNPLVTPSSPQGNSGLPFASSAEVMAFQDWLDITYPTWLNGGALNKNASGGYGNYGSKTSAAYQSYKQQYCDATGVCPLGLVRAGQSIKPAKWVDFPTLQGFLSEWYYGSLVEPNKYQLSTKNPASTKATRTLIDFYSDGTGEFMSYDSTNGIQAKNHFTWYFVLPNLYIDYNGQTYSITPAEKKQSGGYNGIWNMIKSAGFNYFSGGPVTAKKESTKRPESRIFDGTEGQPRSFKLG
jgi:hypothetical protein